MREKKREGERELCWKAILCLFKENTLMQSKKKIFFALSHISVSTEVNDLKKLLEFLTVNKHHRAILPKTNH